MSDRSNQPAECDGTDWCDAAVHKDTCWSGPRDSASSRGCCDACKGTGASSDPETNGQCWDCRGTGHPHDGPC